MVYESCGGCSDLDKARMTEKLKAIDIRLIRRSRPYDLNHPWIDNAIHSHGTTPFHAIIASATVATCPAVLDAGLLDDANPLWCERRSATISRTPDEIARAAATLLGISSEFVFIDPYFRPSNKNHRLPLEKLLQVIARSTNKPIRLEYHIGDGESGRNPVILFPTFDKDCNQWLGRCVPAPLSLKFLRWKQTCLHNRYILTDRGAIEFGTGLDAATGVGSQTDTVNLLDEDVRLDLWKKYVDRAGDLVTAGDPSEVIIAGR
jgi:hypothetical protein